MKDGTLALSHNSADRKYGTRQAFIFLLLFSTLSYSPVTRFFDKHDNAQSFFQGTTFSLTETNGF